MTLKCNLIQVFTNLCGLYNNTNLFTYSILVKVNFLSLLLPLLSLAIRIELVTNSLKWRIYSPLTWNSLMGRTLEPYKNSSIRSIYIFVQPKHHKKAKPVKQNNWRGTWLLCASLRHTDSKPWTQLHPLYIKNKMKTWSMVMQTPAAAISWCQCLSRMAGFWSSVTALREVRRFFILLSIPVKASHALTYQRHMPGISTKACTRDKGAFSCSSGFHFCFIFQWGWHLIWCFPASPTGL